MENLPMNTDISNTRIAWLDHLRIAAIIGVLFFHCAMPFATGEDWHIRNTEESNLLLEFNFFLSRFRMPLLFFISGAITYIMLKRKTVKQFIQIRFIRLMIPLLFGMLVIVPPQVYMERLFQGQVASFWEFIPTVFEFQPYPQGNFSWHHLWFILYLFLYDLIAAGLFAYLIQKKAENKLTFLYKINGKGIFSLTLLPIMAYAVLIVDFPQSNDLIHDWAMHIVYFSFLFCGFLFLLHEPFLISLQENRRFSLTIAFLLTIFVNYMRWNDFEPWESMGPDWRENPLTTLILVAYGALSWFWVLTIVAYGKQFLKKTFSWVTYANQAIYPFYILHQTVIVILAYYVVQVTESILMKYIFLLICSFSISLLIYHLFIRDNRIMRVLFGMQNKSDN